MLRKEKKKKKKKRISDGVNDERKQATTVGEKQKKFINGCSIERRMPLDYFAFLAIQAHIKLTKHTTAHSHTHDTSIT